MSSRLDGLAVVTGASSGIGEAVALALAALGMDLCVTGRDALKLSHVAREARSRGAHVLVHQADLAVDEGIGGLVERVTAERGRLDVLVHAAGTVRLGNVEDCAWEDLDVLYRVDLRAPFLLTKAFLPLLKASQGQVVFVNSTAALAARSENGLYAATKHALRWLTDGIRDHVNRHGVRVLSVYPGRTATPLAQLVGRLEGRDYDPVELLQPCDVADVITAAVTMPRRAEVTDVVVRPMKKPSRGRSTT